MKRILAASVVCSLCVICILCAACDPPVTLPVAGPSPNLHLKPGTVPEPQPITTPYPAVSTAVWNQAGGNQFGTQAVAQTGPVALDPLTTLVEPQQDSEQIPAIGNDGSLYYTVYPELRIYGPDGTLHTVTQLEYPTRESRWGDGKLFIADAGGVAAYDSSGNQLWRTQLPADENGFQLLGSGVAAFRNGVAYVRCGWYDGEPWGHLAAVTSEGSVLWVAKGAGERFSDVAVTDSGIVLVAHDESLYAFRDGAQVWKADHGDANNLSESVEVAPDGRILFAYTYFYHAPEMQSWDSELRTRLLVYNEAGVEQAPLIGGIGTTSWADNVLADGSVGPDNTVYSVDGKSIVAYSVDGSEKWRTAEDYSDPRGAVVGRDGGVYTVTRGGTSYDSNFVARLNTDGSRAWKVTTDTYDELKPLPQGGIVSIRKIYDALGNAHVVPGLGGKGWLYSVVFDGDGNGYYSNGSLLVSFGTDFKQRWTVDDASGDLAAGSDGIVRSVGATSVRAVHSNGSAAWTFTLPGLSHGDLCLGADNTLYVAGVNSQQVVAITPSGQLQWTYTDPLALEDGIAIDQAGNLYFFAAQYKQESGGGDIPQPAWSSGYLVSLERNGALRWRLQVPARPLGADAGTISGSPVVDTDGSILYSDTGGVIHRVSSEGSEVAASPAEFGHLAGILPDGGLLVRTGSNYGAAALACVKRDWSVRWKTDATSAINVPVIDGEGTVYVKFGRGYTDDPEHILRITATGQITQDTLVTQSPRFKPEELAITPRGELVGAAQNGNTIELERIGE